MTRWMLLAVGLSACVSKGRFELLEIQLDATRAAVSARAAQNAEDERELRALVEALEEEVVLRQAYLDLHVIRETLTEQDLVNAGEALAAAKAALVDAQEGVMLSVEPAAPVAPVAQRVLAQRFEATLEALKPVEDRAEFAAVGHYLVVSVPLSYLVQEGWTTLSPRGDVLVTDLATALQSVAGVPVRIDGHTDTTPRHSAKYPSNWERGFGQAITVLRGLEAAGAPVRLSAASVAGSQPLSDFPGDDPRQQRVELWIDLDPKAQAAFASTPEEPEG